MPEFKQQYEDYHAAMLSLARQLISVVALSLDLDFDTVVESVPTCVSSEYPAKYAPYTCGQHKYGRFVDSYEHLRGMV